MTSGDSGSPSWPSAPASFQTSGAAREISLKSSRAGKIALALSLTGWGFVALIAVCVYLVHSFVGEPIAVRAIYILNFAGVRWGVFDTAWIVVFFAGLVAGVIGRRSLTGKCGIALLVFLAVLILGRYFLMLMTPL